MRKSFKYQIYPNFKQCEALFEILDFCRFLYNCALEERISFYKSTGKSINYYDQSAYLKDIRKEFSIETKKIYAQTLQFVLKQLGLSYKSFFRRIKSKSGKAGFPRFKGKDRFKSFCFPQVSKDLSKGCIKIINGKLKIYGIDSFIKIKYHRPIVGIVKQCQIVYQNYKWFLVVSCDQVPEIKLEKTGKSVGIDLGIESFISLDDGTKFRHPKPYKTALEKLQYRQRKLSLKQKGSKNREKQKRLVSKTYEKISNIKDDFQHKLANHLIKEYDEIIIEDLNIQSMLEAKGRKPLHREISDAAWGKFVQKLSYKAESAGKVIKKVNPRNTSRTCCQCGNIKEDLALSDRIYRCESCGFASDRDINAAKNIKKLGTSFAMTKDYKSNVISETPA